LKINGASNGVAIDQAALVASKEELARKLRRVASAPNAQGLFAKGAGGAAAAGSDDRPATSEMNKGLVVGNTVASAGSNSDASALVANGDGISQLAVPETDGLGALLPPPNRAGAGGLAFRRTYSSNSIKVRDVEVGPQSFDKIKLIGKGDVGKVYLVREKKSSRLYAMKGTSERRVTLTGGCRC
jgi:protein-serine/threonine kinase